MTQTTPFARVFKDLRRKSEKSRYSLARYCGLDESYPLRLESGERRAPTRDTTLKIAFGLASGCAAISLHDVHRLLMAG